MTAGLIIRDGTNTPRTVTELIIQDATDTARTITELWMRDASNTPRLIYSTTAALSVAVNNNPVSGVTSGTGTAVSNSTTATPTGGTAPYTYAWTLISHNHPTTPPTIGSPAAAATTFTQSGIGSGASYAATFRCTVTDANGNTASTDVSAIWSDTA